MRIALLLCSVVGGCTTAWKPLNEPTPWSGAGVRAEPVYRVVKKPWFVIAAPDASADVRWVDSRGVKIKPRDVAKRAGEYLDACGASKDWPVVAWGHGSVEQRRAPFDFTVVSIDPTVVLMTPQASSTHSEPQTRGAAPRRWLWSERVVNGFGYGTQLPYGEPLQWFSPDLARAPTPVDAGTGESRVIVLPRGSLRISREGDRWVTLRE